MTNSYFCRKPCNHVGLFKRRGCLICQCIFLPIVLPSCSLLSFFRLHSSASQQSSPVSFFSLNAKMYPRAVCGSWSITVHRSAYSVSHKSSISCSTLPASWPLFLQESEVLVDKDKLTGHFLLFLYPSVTVTPSRCHRPSLGLANQ